MFLMPKFREPDFERLDLKKAPNVKFEEVKVKGIAPDNYHGTSMYPEYYKINGSWTLIKESRMDCVPVILENGEVEAKEFRRLEPYDKVIVGRTEDGSEGIYLHASGFYDEDSTNDVFGFRAGRSRETPYAKDYKKLCDLLKYEKDNGYIVWVLGPAAVFDDKSREAMSEIIDKGYAHAVFGGNAVATHDLEGALFHTALGQDISSLENKKNGHYHHLDTINLVNRAGGIEEAIREYEIDNGVIYSCVKNNIPYVLTGSIRDDGPLLPVKSNMAEAQDAMRYHTRKATTVICLATQLHTIATGNVTPSYTVVNGEVRPVFIYAVDISEFVLNKLRDRGTLEVTTIVSNIHDFLFKVKTLLNQ